LGAASAQELLKRNTSAEDETLAVLKQVLKLPSVTGWSPESRSCLSSEVVKLYSDVSQKAPPPKENERCQRALCESVVKQATILITDI